MNDCTQFDAGIISAAAGDIDTAQQQLLDAHLHGCAGCRTRLALEQRLFAQVDAGLLLMVAEEPSPEFAGRVLAEVTGEAERRLLAAIDAGVAQTVAADPSAQFAAAVRSRIAEEPAPRRTWFAWNWGTLAAAGALAGIIIFALAPRNGAPPAVTTPPAVPPQTTSAQKVDPSVQQVLHAVPPAPRTPKGPEVLIPENERQTVTRFYRFVQEGRINTAQVLEANRFELAARLEELKTPVLVAASSPVRTLDLVDSPRSTSDEH